MCPAEKLRASESGASDGVAEGLRLWFGGRGSRQGSLRFRGRGGMGEQLDLFADGATEVVERFTDVGRIVIGFVRILGSVRSVEGVGLVL